MKKATNLAEIQKEFWKYLSSYNKTPSDIRKFVDNDDRFSIEERLEIYGNAYLWRLQDAIIVDFPVLEHFMGTEALQNAIKDYLAKYPSDHFAIGRASAKFPQFIGQHSIIETYPWADELAQFEWAKVCLFDNADHKVLSKQELMDIPPEKWPGLKFKLIPNLTLLPTSYRVEELCENLEETTLPLKPNPQTLKVWRRKEEIYYDVTSSEEDELFMAIRAGNNFNEICSQFAQKRTEQEAAQTVFKLISTWLEEELIESISY